MGAKLRKAFSPDLHRPSYFPTTPNGSPRPSFHWAEYICFMGTSRTILVILAFIFIAVLYGCSLFKKGCGDCPKWGKIQETRLKDRTSV